MKREPGSNSTEHNNSLWLYAAALLVVGLSALTLFMSVGGRFAGPKAFWGVWDDSLMLVRYAHNVATCHAIAWNRGAQPSYGLTSPYYFMLVVVPVSKFVTAQAVAIPVFSSLISGALFFPAMAFVVLRLIPGPIRYRLLAAAVIALAIARSADDFSQHLVSGMDTCFALLFMAVYIGLATWHSQSGTIPSALFTGLAGGLAYGVRPDLLAWTVLVPAGWILLSNQKRSPIVILASTFIVLVLELGIAAEYFHSALPLPFYAKSTQIYSGLTGYRYIAVHSLFLFLLSYWLLFLLIGLDISLDVRSWWRVASPLEKGLIAGTLIHFAYFTFWVTQIMPYAQRFYYPALPALIYLSANAVVRLLGRIPSGWAVRLSGVARPYRYAALAATALVLPVHVGELDMFGQFLHGNFASFRLMDEYKQYYRSYWFGLDHFSTLPADAVIATTEVGHVGAMNLDKVVVDIAGLNDPLFVHHRFSAAEFFQHYRPDLIYMPHPGYRAMNQDLENSPIMKSEYELIPAAKLGTQSMGIALKRDSRYYPDMRKMVLATCQERAAGECAL